MSLDNRKSLGNIHIDHSVIAKCAGYSAMETPGIVGMASQKKLKDGVFELLQKENASKGVEVIDEGKVTVNLYIVISYGINISEVSISAQKKVHYDLTNLLGLDIEAVNLYVQGVVRD